MTGDPVALRARVERLRGEVARAEGEASSLEAEVAENLERLRELLGCKPGKEKEAITSLREVLARSEAEVDRLLSEAEAAGRRKGDAT